MGDPETRLAEYTIDMRYSLFFGQRIICYLYPRMDLYGNI